VRDNPPPFWAMESLLKEYPISSAEGLALMRLAEALLRVPDAETAIALTADQLGRADFDGSSDKVLSRLSSTAIAMSKHFLPPAPGSAVSNEPGLIAKLGARTVVAATLRAVQLLGRQFVLGQTMAEGQQEASAARKRKCPGCATATTCWARARAPMPMPCMHLQSYQNAISEIAASARADWACEQNDGISIKLSALHPRYEYAQLDRVMAELVPRVWCLCEQAARANINLTIDAEEVDRLELSLEVFEALMAKVAQQQPQWRGFGLAMQSYQTTALELVAHVTELARKYGVRLMCRLVKGAYWDAEIKRAQELGLPTTRFLPTSTTPMSVTWPVPRRLLEAPDAIYPQFATHNAATVAAILQMAAKTGAPFELQRLHGMGEGVYREVLKNPLVACRVYAPVGAHKDLLAYLVRRLLENGANSSFVHQLADETVPIADLLISPLRLEPLRPCHCHPICLACNVRANSCGLDLTVPAMRDPLLAALAALQCRGA
jgi:RHH-type proline utilization regulon transcriptional repressor/proline dehydrogenase/delta 1-pyrroline-5-carboxylate dehydrogenase